MAGIVGCLNSVVSYGGGEERMYLCCLPNAKNTQNKGKKNIIKEKKKAATEID